MARVTRTFSTPTDPTGRLADLGWAVEDADGAVVATQGSQLRTRLLGGWFVGAGTLPKRVEVRPLPGAGGYELQAEDDFGFGYVDRRFRARYERAFEELEELLAA